MESIMDMLTLIDALTLVDTNSITIVVYAWGAFFMAALVAMPALLSYQGTDYHTLNVLTDKQVENEFFG